MADYEGRRGRLRRAIRKENCNAMLVSDASNVTYLTGFSGDSSYLWIDRDKEILISDGRFEEQIQEECPELEASIRHSTVTLAKATVKVIKKSKPSSLLLEAASLTKAAYDDFEKELAPVSVRPSLGLVERLRERKDKDEIRLIERAIAIAEQAFQEVRQRLTKDMSEKKVADDLEYAIRCAGGTGSSFRTIVGVGPRAALPHGIPSARKLGENPFVLIDWGAREGLYVSDLTRVLATGALPSKFERIYHVVLAAQQAAIHAIRPGALMSEIDAAARSVIAQAGFGKRFNHGLGHGFGLQVHESIRLARGQDRKLETGMVLTVEPGIYLPGWGGVRIEDDCLVTNRGCRVLSTLPRELDANRVPL